MKQHFGFVALTAVCITTSATAGELPANSTNGNSSPTLIAQAQPEASRPKQKNYVSVTSSFGRVLKSGFEGIADKSINEYGVTGKIGVSENISIRPFISAGIGSSRENLGFSTPIDVEFTNATVGVAATYDLNLSNSDFTPYGGIGYSSSVAKASVAGSNQSIERTTSGVYLEVGTDYQLPASNIVLNANYKLQDGGGLFGISVGYGF
jgi:opacity protein-like surface antigen